MSPRARHLPMPPWHVDRPGLERAVRIDPTGRAGPTPGEAQGRRWRSVAPGWFRPAAPPSSVEQRIVEASYRLPGHGAVTGWAALRWLGGRWSTGTGPGGSLRDVPLAIGSAHRAHRPGTSLSKERLRPDDVIEVDGLRVTVPVRSVVLEMRAAIDLDAAVAALDLACFNDLVSIDEVARALPAWRGSTGIGRCREALPLADENTWSPAESRLRLLWTRGAGLGPVVTNRPVLDHRGRLVATPDLLDVGCGVAGEWQGEHHFERGQRRRDLAREQELRGLGLEYVELVAGEPRDRVLARLRGAYARAARLPAADRAWTVELPAGWHDTSIVAARRSLPPRLRQRLLAHRAIDRAA